MKNINKTQTISELLNTFTFGENSSKGKSFSDTIKQSTMFSFWEEIVGKKLSKYTKPIKVKGSKLYVSAKSAVIAQELSLLKQKILTKLKTYSNALGIEIKDIIFDYKNYTDNEQQIPKDDIPELYSEESLLEYSVDENFIDEAKKNINKINFLNESQKKNLLKQIINTQKAHLKRLKELDKK